MSEMTLKDLSEKMGDIDFCMLTTKGSNGMSSRPMSNNGDVEYDGDSWFFSYADTEKVRQMEADDQVSLTFTGAESLLGSPGIFITIEGRGSIIRDKAQFEAHWTSELDIWFPEGIDTPGIALLKVHAGRIRYWDGDDQGEIKV